MRNGFTLIELLVVIGIMGLLGSVSVGGYRAMQRGMAERGVMGDVNSFIRAAYQRAQVDRQPTAVYFWNETLRAGNDDLTEIVVGKAVAIRRAGRITKKDGQYLYDEFGDLELSYQTDQDENGGADEANTMFLYPMDDLTKLESSGNLKRSTVSGKVFQGKFTPFYLSQEETNGQLNDESNNGEITRFGFKVENAGGVEWNTGAAYGFEFAQLELPHGYIFGSSYSKDVKNPVQEAGAIVFGIGANYGSGMSGSAGIIGRYSIAISNLRPGENGIVSAQTVGNSEDPTKELNN